MALTRCSECGLQVSDKALSCPHCGMPFSELANITKQRRKNRKRMKLPNGFGSITEIKSKNLRKPFMVRVCVGKNIDGRPVLKLLKPESYFKTYNEAYEALINYHSNPYDLDKSMTVQELYEKWTSEYFKELSPNATRNITAAWAYCSSVATMRAKDLRARHIKGCIEEGFRIETRGKHKGEKISPSPHTKERIKSMFNCMLDYALEYEIVDKNYARTFDISKNITKEKKVPHIIFTEEEIQILWDNVGRVKYVDWILIQCYMGWRPQELANITLDEVHLDEGYIQSGMKTEAGKQRIVPILPNITELVRQNVEFAKSIGSDRLFNDKGQTHAGSWTVTYDKYKHRFDKVIKQLGLNPDHRPHDPRMTFITWAKKMGVDSFAIKEMVGHSIQDITESVYTVRDLEWLKADLVNAVSGVQTGCTNNIQTVYKQ